MVVTQWPHGISSGGAPASMWPLGADVPSPRPATYQVRQALLTLSPSLPVSGFPPPWGRSLSLLWPQREKTNALLSLLLYQSTGFRHPGDVLLLYHTADKKHISQDSSRPCSLRYRSSQTVQILAECTYKRTLYNRSEVDLSMFRLIGSNAHNHSVITKNAKNVKQKK